MTRTIQILRGTTAQNNAFTGSAGELTMDTDKKTVRIHDGSTQGGHELVSVSKLNSGITNCITNIPQDIKLELNAGALTLKAGSKVCVPNGVNTFDTLIIENDLTLTVSTSVHTASFMLWVKSDCSALDSLGPNLVFSGTTSPGQASTLWYDTTNNLIKRFGPNSSTTPEYTTSFPIAIFTTTTGVGVSSIDQVFNGLGYIGSTVFALPGLTIARPNGRNADGTCKNIITTLTSVQTGVIADTNRRVAVFLSDTLSSWGADQGNVRCYNFLPSIAPRTFVTAYSYYDNQWHRCMGSTTWSSVETFAQIAHVQTDSNARITSFIPKVAVSVVDYNDTEFIAHQAMPGDTTQTITFGASGTTYTAPADGFFILRAENSGLSNHWINVTAYGQFIGNYWAQVANNSFGLPPFFIHRGGTIRFDYGSDIWGGTLYFVKCVGAQ